MFQIVLTGILFHSFGIRSATADDDQRHLFRYIPQCLDSQQHILPLLYRADTDDITLRQVVFLAHQLALIIGGALLEPCTATLVNQVYLLRFYASEKHDIPLGTLADGNNPVGLCHRLAEFPCVEFRVEPLVILGMAQEYQVVNGDNRLDARLLDSDRKLSRQTMIELNSVLPELTYHAMGAP